jgi:hypothetical protein
MPITHDLATLPFPPLEQYLSLCIRQNRETVVKSSWLLRPGLQFQIVVSDQKGQADFQLSRSKEPARTRPNAVAKIDVVRSGAAVLVLHLVAGLVAQFGEAESVKFVGIRPEFAAAIDGRRANHDRVAGRDGVSGGGREAFWVGDEARDVSCGRTSSQRVSWE